MYIRVTLYWGYLIVLWLFHLVCICNVVVWTCFVMCVGECMCGCFSNMCTCIYCVLYCLYCDFVLFHFCIFILICLVYTNVRTTATEWKLNYGSGKSSSSRSGGGGGEKEVIYKSEQRRDNQMHLTLSMSNHIHKFAKHFHGFRAETFQAKRHTRTPSDTITHNTCHLGTLGNKSRTTAVTRHAATACRLSVADGER